METKQEDASVDMEPNRMMMSDGVTPIKGLREQTWSMSKLKVLESCPLQFYLSYLKKFRHIDENQDTIERDLGTTIHYLLELMQSGMTIAEAYDATELKYHSIVGADNWPRIIGMLPSVRKFNRMLHDKDEQSNFDYVEPEMKMAVNRDWEPVDFFSPDAYFRGVVDYMARHGDEALVIDFKKGGNGWLTKYHTPQLTSYLLLDYYCNGAFTKGTSYIYYVENAELSRGPVIEGRMIESHSRRWLDDKIETAIAAVEEEGYFKHQRCNLCKYCDYAPLCKDGKRGTCGSLAKYSIESKEIL